MVIRKVQGNDKGKLWVNIPTVMAKDMNLKKGDPVDVRKRNEEIKIKKPIGDKSEGN